jgi:hypothetical protein
MKGQETADAILIKLEESQMLFLILHYATLMQP